MNRSRMIFEIPADVQMAIRLRCAKTRQTTGAVVTNAVIKAIPDEVREARQIIKQRKGTNVKCK